MTLAAGGQTSAAAPRPAGAGRAAAAAAAATAVVAAAAAVSAQVGPALLAGGQLVGVGRTAAVVARGAVPLVQSRVGALRVVGGQRAIHDREEIQHASLGQRRLQRRAGRSLAEPLVAHVGMHDAAPGGRPGLERHDPITEPLAGPAEHNLEGAQRDSFQRHRRGDDGRFAACQINPRPGEFFRERGQVAHDLGDRRRGWHAGQPGEGLIDRPPQFEQPLLQTAAGPRLGMDPASLSSQRGTTGRRGDLVPGRVGRGPGRLAVAAPPGQGPGSAGQRAQGAAHAAPSIFSGVIETRSPGASVWSAAAGWRLTRIR